MALDPGIELFWYGHSMFVISGDGTTVAVDPVPPEVGYRYDPVEADVVLMSHQHFDHSFIAGIKGSGSPNAISAAGTFEVGRLTIEGIASYHDAQQGRQRGPNIIFTWEQGGMKLAHLGDLGDLPGPAVMKKLTGVDVAMVPVGGVFTIDGEQAARLVRDLAPKVVLPMHYATPDCSIKLDGPEVFTGRFSGEVRTIPDRPLKISADILPVKTEAWIVPYQ
ncbi:MAG: MBL fold metallo-hydrolase [Actinomycetota bacterium]